MCSMCCRGNFDKKWLTCWTRNLAITGSAFALVCPIVLRPVSGDGGIFTCLLDPDLLNIENFCVRLSGGGLSVWTGESRLFESPAPSGER